MSYCVNCGVELEASIVECPLCNTPVINPNKSIMKLQQKTPFPKEKGQVDVVKHTDFAILLTIVLLSTGITCGLLNLFFFQDQKWSLPIIGLCAVIWVFSIPAVIYTKLSSYTSVFFDAVAVLAYIGVIAYMAPVDEWYYAIAIPIVALITILIEILIYLLKKFKISFLTTAIYAFSEMGIFCVGVEIIVDLFLYNQINLSWSAIVITVCVIIVITLTTIVSKERFREAVRRRLHF